MEATTLQKKKNNISKGKLKKNIRNVLCRPDQVFWPEITEDQRKKLEISFKKYSIEIPQFKKPHWKDIKLIPKEQRPKPPKIKKVEGLLFGISECSDAIQNDRCSSIIIEAKVNPRMIVQPIIDLCTSKNIPLLCMKDLRKLTLSNFGIKTSCLGIKNEWLTDLRNEIMDITKLYPKSNKINKELIKKEDIIEAHKICKELIVKEDDICKEVDSNKMDITESPYLYRTSKKTRVFVPLNNENLKQPAKTFIEQDFIEFSEKIDSNSKTYMKMIMKRISNNANRVKKK